VGVTEGRLARSRERCLTKSFLIHLTASAREGRANCDFFDMVTDFDFIHNTHPLDHATKDRILAVKKWRRCETDIELATTRLTIGIDLITSPRHRHCAPHVLFGRTNFCGQFVPWATCAIAGGVTALNDKARLDSMEGQVIVKTLFGELFEIRYRLRRLGWVELKDDFAAIGIKNCIMSGISHGNSV
jgi:hypothetical protein